MSIECLYLDYRSDFHYRSSYGYESLGQTVEMLGRDCNGPLGPIYARMKKKKNLKVPIYLIQISYMFWHFYYAIIGEIF